MDNNEKIQEFKRIIEESNNIVFFGGAGVSTESGIPDFRSTNGLYNQEYDYPPEQILSHTFFVQKPEEFYRFYRKKILIDAVEPNITHKKLAELEAKGKLKAVITQNIDGLHQKAGSKEVYEVHGTVAKNYCTKCHKFFDGDAVQRLIDEDCERLLDAGENVPYERKAAVKTAELSARKASAGGKRRFGIPHCDECGSIIKPDVVLYEEGLDDYVWNKSCEYIKNADVLIVGGTSLVVYPAAGLINYYRGNKLILINKSATEYDKYANLVLNVGLGEVFSQI
ncbi:MAG: NAD-dependent deacylase [Lachnospiraceae bacterium]|nr:NAD-dependent deacylase [Lachnospiraceae bacterium]